MVQTVDQFAFIHKLILEKYLLPDSDVSSEDFFKQKNNILKFSTQMKEDFNKLGLVPPASTRKKTNEQGGMNSQETLSDSRSAAFNETKIKGYRNKRMILSLNSPNQTNARDFLQLLIDYSVSLVINIKHQTDESRYWLNDQNTFDDMTVVSDDLSTQQEFPSRNLTIKQGIFKHNLKLMEVDIWIKNEDGNKISKLLHKLVQEVYSLWNENSTIVIQSQDGFRHSGVLCVLLRINERLKFENRVDLFRTVKDLKDVQPKMISTFDEYETCCHAASEIIASL